MASLALCHALMHRTHEHMLFTWTCMCPDGRQWAESGPMTMAWPPGCCQSGPILFMTPSTPNTLRQVHATGVAGDGTKVSYTVMAVVAPWRDTTGCNATSCSYPSTHPMPAHGNFTWRATLQPQPSAGGVFDVTASTSAGGGSAVTMSRVTYGDVYFCSGQSK
jgi:hypothetical protein